MYKCITKMWSMSRKGLQITEDNREDARSLNPGNSVTLLFTLFIYQSLLFSAAAAAAKSLHSCPTLCDPIDGSPPCSSVPGILQARTLEWVAIYFSNAWKWKVKVKSLSCVWLFATHGLQCTRLLCPWDFQGKSTRVGCHCLLRAHVPTY